MLEIGVVEGRQAAGPRAGRAPEAAVADELLVDDARRTDVFDLVQAVDLRTGLSSATLDDDDQNAGKGELGRNCVAHGPRSHDADFGLHDRARGERPKITDIQWMTTDGDEVHDRALASAVLPRGARTGIKQGRCGCGSATNEIPYVSCNQIKIEKFISYSSHFGHHASIHYQQWLEFKIHSRKARLDAGAPMLTIGGAQGLIDRV